jgi:hypothetical protein
MLVESVQSKNGAGASIAIHDIDCARPCRAPALSGRDQWPEELAEP